jgi:regulatory protein YycI of two-component signal transduction system YycFG
MAKNKTNAYQTKKKEERKICWIGHTFSKPQSAIEIHALHWKIKVQRRGEQKEYLEKNKRMRTAEGRRKLERSKRTILG